MKYEDPITCHLIALCITLWNNSDNGARKRHTISLSLSEDTLDKHAGLTSLIELIDEQLKKEGAAMSLESYVSKLRYIEINPSNISRLPGDALTEKTKSAIGFYFLQMFKGKCIHKIPELRAGYATTEFA